MLSYVWPQAGPFLPGVGGTENYTIGHIRELQRRGIAAEIITIAQGTKDGREYFPDIPFRSVDSKDDIAKLDSTVLFSLTPIDVTTKKQSYVILHCAPPLNSKKADREYPPRALRDKKIIATSKFAAQAWQQHLGTAHIDVVYPFADEAFARAARKPHHGKARILLPNRLSPDKGIYTFFAALHFNELFDPSACTFSVTDGFSEPHNGAVLRPLLDAHPLITRVAARTNAKDMAALMAMHDVVVVPSMKSEFWRETFGMTSVEAQHAGCRVVATNDGGLPETDCGGLILVEPNDPIALAKGLAKAVRLGALGTATRKTAAQHYTVSQSVDALLQIVQKA